jgi:hypothetical protein
MPVVNEIVTAFSFKGNTNPLKDFNKEMTTVIPKMTKLSLGLLGIGSLFAKVLTSVSLGNSFVQFANRTGESVKNIQALELASVKFGASLTSSLETTQSLSKALATARLKGNEAFGQFGLTIINESGELKKTADILKDINELFNSTNRIYGELADKRQKLIVLQTLGIKEDLLPLLTQTTEEYRKQLKMSEQLSLSKEQVKSIREFNNSLRETNTIIGQIVIQTSANFGKSFKGITDGANEFLKANKDIVIEISDMVVKTGLVLGAFGALKILAKGLSFVISGAFAPLTAFMLAFEAFESGAFSRLGKKLGIFSDDIVKTPRLPMPKDEQGRFLDLPTLGGEATRRNAHQESVLKRAQSVISGNRPFFMKNAGAFTQTNTFHITTDSPKVMADTIENTVNKGVRLIQETSTRGGI